MTNILEWKRKKQYWLGLLGVVLLCLAPIIPTGWMRGTDGPSQVSVDIGPVPLQAGTRVRRTYDGSIPKGSIGTIRAEWGTMKGCNDGYSVQYDHWSGGGLWCEPYWKIERLP